MQSIKKLIYVGLGIVLGMWVINSVMPYHWGNFVYSKKLDCINSSNKKYNTFFFGNSKIFHHLIPAQFDAITDDPEDVSYNIAIDGGTTFENQFLIKRFIETQQPERIFVTANLYNPPKESQSLRPVYFWTFGDLKKVWPFLAGHKKEKRLHLRYYIRNLLKLGAGASIIGKSKSQTDLCIDDGFYALDGLYPEESKLLERKYPKFVSSLEKAKKRNYKLAFKRKKPSATKDELNARAMAIDLYEFGQDHDVEIYFVFYPNKKLYFKLDLPNSIYMGDGVENPHFFDKENWFDKGHLNGRGAKLFTEILANAYNDK